MRKARPALGAALIVLASFLALSCNNAYGIFQSVQGERAQDGSKIFQKTAAYSAFLYKGNYYASTIRLNRRPVADGSSWSKLTIGGSGSYVLRSAVLVGSDTTGTVYALVGIDSSSVALYSSTDGDNWTTVAGLPASSVVAHAGSSYAVEQLFSANGQLYAVGHAYLPDSSNNVGTSWYDLYHYNGSGFDPVTNRTDLAKTLRGVAYDGANYWFASEDILYSGTVAAGVTDQTAPFTGLSSNLIWHITYTNGFLYVATQNGYLYQGPGSAARIDSDSRPLTDVVVPYAGLLLVGTDTKDITYPAIGYYEGNYPSLSEGSSNAIVSSTSSIYNTTVGSFPVHSFFYDTAAQNLFVCISPGASNSSFYGLYESHYDGSSWSGWSAQ